VGSFQLPRGSRRPRSTSSSRASSFRRAAHVSYRACPATPGATRSVCRSGTGAGQARAFSCAPVDHRTPPSRAYDMHPLRLRERAITPCTSSAAAHAFAVRPSAASTVTEAQRRVARCAATASERPGLQIATASERRVLSESRNADRAVCGTRGRSYQRYWPPRSSSALSTNWRAPTRRDRARYPGAMLSTAEHDSGAPANLTPHGIERGDRRMPLEQPNRCDRRNRAPLPGRAQRACCPFPTQPRTSSSPARATRARHRVAPRHRMRRGSGTAEELILRGKLNIDGHGSAADNTRCSSR